MKKVLLIALAFAVALGNVALGEGISVTTGLPIDKENKPILCQMDNEPGARPQMGIGSADVVYETEVYNGGYTRYTAVFNDTIPKLVEAIRSARMVHIDIYQEWGGIFACYGFQTTAETDARAYAKQVVPVLYNGHAGDSGFYRDTSRRAPNNVVFKMAEKYDSVEQSFPEKSPFTFSDTPTVQGDAVDHIEVRYQGSYVASYVWDEASQTYLRSYNGKPHADGATGMQLAYNNVIVQRADYSWYGGNGDRPVVAMTGKNSCDYFIGGHHFTGYWERSSASENTRYYDDAGNLVQFARGKTFVQIAKPSVGLKYGLGVAMDPSGEGMRNGSRGEDVKALQQLLVAKGFLSGAADGIFGPATEAAVKSAQANFGMEQTGVADAELMQKLAE